MHTKQLLICCTILFAAGNSFAQQGKTSAAASYGIFYFSHL